MKHLIKTMLSESLGTALSNEAVSFQHDRGLYLALVACFEPLVAKGRSKAVTAKDVRECGVVNVIKEHTNLTFNLGVWSGMLNACVYPPQFDSSHPFYNGWYRGATEDIAKLIARAKEPIRGSIDLQKGWVTGVYAELDMKMMLGTELFTCQMTAEHVAAITLHEIGHVMSYLEFLGDFGQFNLLLLGLCKAVTQKQPVEKKIEIIKLIESHTGSTVPDKEEIAKSDNVNDYVRIIVSDRPTGTRSSSGSFMNDIKAWEFASDQFAVRMGAGKALVEGMTLLYKLSGSPSAMSTGRFIFCQIMEVISLIMLGVWSVGILPLVLIVLYSPYASTYDNDAYRVKRMRLSVLEALKDKELEPDVRKRLNEEIESIDKIASILQDREGVLDKIKLMISPSTRKEKREILIQQLTESLGNNDLFLAGSRFKTQ